MGVKNQGTVSLINEKCVDLNMLPTMLRMKTHSPFHIINSFSDFRQLLSSL